MSYAHFCRDIVVLSLVMMLKAEEKEINCGSQFTTRAGTINSPNYPGNYPPNSFCVWTINVNGKDPQIKLKFSNFDLPGKVNGKCSDYVSIYHATQSKLLNKYCGTAVPPSQVVEAETVRIEFLSDTSGSADGFFLSFTASVSSNAITTSQATAGIVAAIFCGIVFIGVAAMRCIMMGACQNCHSNQQQNQNRECVGTNETLSNYVMDCPPSYRTVMEHPESFPTPNISPYPTPTSSPRLSRIEDEDEDGEPPPPYSQIVPTVATTSGITAHEVAEYLISDRQHRNITTVSTHLSRDSLPIDSQRDSNRTTDHREEGHRGRVSNQSGSNEINNSVDNGINNQSNSNGTTDQSVDSEINNRTTNQGDSNGTIDRDDTNDTTRRSDDAITDQNNIDGITQRNDHTGKPESVVSIHNYVEVRL